MRRPRLRFVRSKDRHLHLQGQVWHRLHVHGCRVRFMRSSDRHLHGQGQLLRRVRPKGKNLRVHR